MTTHAQDVQHEHDQIMAYLDDVLASCSTRRVQKSVNGDDAHHGKAREFPPTRAGLAAFAKSSGMQGLLVSDPVAFRQKYMDFILDRELVRHGEVTPTEVGSWAHQLEALPRVGSNRQPVINKAVTHADPQPRPWDFEPTPRGLAGFLHSQEMQVLAKAQPARWRQEHLDFFADMTPAPGPREISMRRQELEMKCPDRTPSTVVAKAVAPDWRLTTGQSTLIANFGSAIGDPEKWMIRR